MNVLVTGIAGFIGFFVSKKLAELGYRVIGVDNINNYYDINLKISRLKELGFNENFNYNETICSSKYKNLFFNKLNIEDYDNLKKIFFENKFDLVINLAAQAGVRYSLENPFSYIQSNINGFQSVIQCCVDYNVNHFVYASSSSVYGKNSKIPFSENDNLIGQESLYAVTKKSNEDISYTYNKLYNINCTGLRFFTVYGPYGRPDMAPFLFTDSILKNETLNVFNNGLMFRDFTYIDDIVEGLLLCIKNPNGNQIFNIGNGNPVNLLKFIECIEKKLGIVSNKKMMPMQKGDVEKTFSDISKIKKIGYCPKIDIDKGISNFVEWFLKYYNIKIMLK